MLDPRRRAVIERAHQRRTQRPGSRWMPLLLSGLLLAACLLFVLLLGALALTQQGQALQASGPAPTILLLGVDRRAEESGPTRSDSIILLGQNAQSGEVGLLSIPRDLWVSIPDVGEQRINTALFFGYDPADPAAGPRLAMHTVQQELRQPVEHYALVDFATFVRAVDALGGIEVDVPSAIVDTEYPTPDYGITTVRFDPGPQTLDGARALIYVRTRHSDDDFGRSQRQLQVLQALAVKVLQPATWPRLPELVRVLRAGVVTDLTLRDATTLWPLAAAIADGEINTATLEDATTPWTTSGGAWVLLPDTAAVQQIVADLFGAR